MEKRRRKWENLDMDCLVNIFGRVGIESLALDVPFVCKSWYKATLNPLCWQSLVFPKDLRRSRFECKDPSITFIVVSVKGEGDTKNVVKGGANTCNVVKGAVNRSQRSAIKLVLPYDCKKEELIYALEECPALEVLVLRPSGIFLDGGFAISSMINKLKNLEALLLEFNEDLEEILLQISLHCKNFVYLSVFKSEISSDAANAIATLLPNIKYLVLKRCVLERSDLVIIINGCKKLVRLDVSHCRGFESNDEEILKLASHITTFKCQGSYIPNYNIFEPLSSRDVDFSEYWSD